MGSRLGCRLTSHKHKWKKTWEQNEFWPNWGWREERVFFSHFFCYSWGQLTEVVKAYPTCDCWWFLGLTTLIFLSRLHLKKRRTYIEIQWNDLAFFFQNHWLFSEYQPLVTFTFQYQKPRRFFCRRKLTETKIRWIQERLMTHGRGASVNEANGKVKAVQCSGFWEVEKVTLLWPFTITIKDYQSLTIPSRAHLGPLVV